MTDPHFRRLTLITGASSGIGTELARICAAKGHDLALVARSSDALHALAEEIAASGAPRPLVIVLDLAGQNAGEELERALAQAGASVSILINNAGFGLAGPAGALNAREQIEMIDLNVRNLSDLTLRFLPQIIAARGRIMNVASVAAFLPGPGMATYYATKSFVVSFSESLWQELRATGVTVTALCPGLTTTGFQARAGLDTALLKNMPTQSARDVAMSGYEAMMAGRRRIVTGAFNKLTVALMPFMPRALLLPLLGYLQAKRRDG